MSVINYIDPLMGNSSTFASKENHNRITPWEHMLQKEGICQLRHFTANGIALRTYCCVPPNISDGNLVSVSDGYVHPSA